MKIPELTLVCSELDEMAVFYSELLGFHLLSRTEDHFSVQIGSSILNFKQAAFGEKPFYHAAFNIPHNLLEAAKNWLEKRVDLIPLADNEAYASFESWNAKAVYFYDPAGNIMEFIARFDLPDSSETSFSAESVLSISEIGLVTEDVLTLNKQLLEKKLFPFAKHPGTDLFKALGDDEGLLLLVKADRIWYPTNKTAIHYPVKVRLKIGTQTINFEF